MANNRKKQQPKEQKKVAPLTPRQKQIMMSILIRDIGAYFTAASRLTPAEFSEYDRVYAIVWGAVQRHQQKFGDLPTYDWLAAEVEAFLERSSEELTDNELEQLNDFLVTAFDIEVSENDVKVARMYLSTFLKERLFDRFRAEMTAGDSTPEDLDLVLSNLASKVSAIETLRGSAVTSPFESEDWRPKPLKLVTTLCPFFDEFLSGGDAPGEVYGLMGPYGSCKTTLAVQLSISRARYYYDQWRQAEDARAPLGVSYYFFYESYMDAYTARAISFASQIDVDVIRKGAAFSTADDLKPYERELFAAQLAEGAYVPGEKERSEISRKVLMTNWRVIDMTGNDPKNPGRGSGGAQEIRDIIQADLEANPGTFCAGVYIDYVGELAKRYAMVHDGHFDGLRHHVGGFPGQASRLIANRFNTPVYLCHQLNGGENSKKGGAADHTGAAEAKNFGENCDFCFQVGRPNNDQLAVFSCTKFRRAAPKSETVIHIDGKFSTVRCTEGKYTFDQTSKRIVLSNEKKKLIDPDSVKRPKAAGDSQSEFGRF